MSCKIRRCHIVCCMEDVGAVENCLNKTTIPGRFSIVYAVQSVKCAYNPETKTARIYMETDRMPESTMERYLKSCGASSIVIESLAVEDWESASFAALKSVVECSKKDGMISMEFGGEPKAGLRYMKRPRITEENMGIYVLKFNDGASPLYYVGKSKDISQRLDQHVSGHGAACVTGRSFSRISPVTSGSIEDMESWERHEVLELMLTYGINAVRGWKYTFQTMQLEQKLSAFDDVCERFDLCRRCGRRDHFVRECGALATDRWTNGLDLRTRFLAHASDSQESVAKEREARLNAEAIATAERQARLDVERRNAEAVRVLMAHSSSI